MEVTNSIIEKVAYAVGFDISDEKSNEYIELLIRACIDDIEAAGVNVDLVKSSNLLLATFIIFCTDNLAAAPGTYQTSNMYLNNVEKMRNLK